MQGARRSVRRNPRGSGAGWKVGHPSKTKRHMRSPEAGRGFEVLMGSPCVRAQSRGGEQTEECP